MEVTKIKKKNIVNEIIKHIKYLFVYMQFSLKVYQLFSPIKYFIISIKAISC